MNNKIGTPEAIGFALATLIFLWGIFFVAASAIGLALKLTH